MVKKRPNQHSVNEKQSRFIDEYMVDMSPKNAAKRAGYSSNNADKYGSELLSKPWVRAEVDRRIAERANRVMVSQDYVLTGLLQLAERCMQEIKPVTNSRGEPVLDEDGNAVFKFDSAGAAKAYELLGKHLGMFRDKVDVRAEVLTNEQCDAAVKAFLMDRK